MNKSAEEIVKEIDALVGTIWQNLDNPEVLSRSILQMTALYAGIGNYLMEARDEERQRDSTYKYKVETMKLGYVAEGDSATVAESKAKRDSYHNLDQLHVANKRVDTLKLKREDVEKVLDATRSRLSLIKGEIQRG